MTDESPRPPANGATHSSAVRAVYEGPLAEFVARRRALVQRLRSEGDRELAEAIARWSKPSQSLWAVNQWYWQHPEELALLQQIGADLAAAVAGRGSATVQDASSVRQQRVTAAVARCVVLLEAEGFGTGRQATDPIQRTLEALTVHHLRPGAVVPGRVGGPGALVEMPAVPDFSDLLELGVTVDLSRSPAAAASAVDSPPGPPVSGGSAEQVDRRQRQQQRRRLQSRLRRARERSERQESEWQGVEAELQASRRSAVRATTLVERRQRQLEEATAALAESEAALARTERAHSRAELEREKVRVLIARLEAELDA